jgi:undecaprenyl-diphosphatase
LSGLETKLRSVFVAVRDQGWWPLVAVTLIGGALLAFVEIIDEVEDGETHDFDRAVLLFFRQAGDPSRPSGWNSWPATSPRSAAPRCWCC